MKTTFYIILILIWSFIEMFHIIFTGEVSKVALFLTEKIEKYLTQ
jgi:hypothetical protein